MRKHVNSLQQVWMQKVMAGINSQIQRGKLRHQGTNSDTVAKSRCSPTSSREQGSYLCSSRRPCSGHRCSRSSPAHTASCSRMTSVGMAAVGTALGRESEKLRARPPRQRSHPPNSCVLHGSTHAQASRPCPRSPGRQDQSWAWDSRAATCQLLGLGQVMMTSWSLLS